MRLIGAIGVVIVGVAVASHGAGWAVGGSPRFELVAETFGTTQRIQGLGKQIEQGKLGEAATALDALLDDDAHQLAGLDEGGLISVSAWASALPRPQGKALAAEYRRLFDGAAKQALDALRQDRSTQAERFYVLGRRYLLSSIGATAFAEAGDRAAVLGDFAAACCYYSMAQEVGWTADADHVSRWAVCRMLNGETEGDLGAKAGSRGVELGAKLSGYRGPVVSDAAWYGRADSVGRSMYFPQAADGVLYFAASRQVLAIREGGQVLWRWASTEAWARSLTSDRPSDKGRGPSFTCVVFAGAAGAQIVLVRQPKPVGPDFCLRAFRAVDGKLLWTTESAPEFDRLSVASSPAGVGRYVYVTAVDFAGDRAALVLVAVDLLDGRIIFKSQLGTMVEFGRRREDAPGWDDFWEQSEAGVGGDAVYVAPHVGVAFCVGRFDGEVRWARIYEPAASGKVWRDRGQAAPRAEYPTRQARPVNPNELLRWRGTPQVCGKVVVIAPQDGGGVWGLDAVDGRVLWDRPSPPAYALIGHTESAAVFGGGSVVSVEAATGEVRWRYEALKPIRVSGPPVVAGGAVHLPTSDQRVIVISLDTGKPMVPKSRPPNIRQVLGWPAAKKALEEAMIIGGSGTAGSQAP